MLNTIKSYNNTQSMYEIRAIIFYNSSLSKYMKHADSKS